MAKRVLRKVKSKLKARKPKLTKRQLAQRRYAAAMRGIRKRASKTRGGSGRIRRRGPATKLRRRLGLKN